MDFQVGGEARPSSSWARKTTPSGPSATVDFHLGANAILEYRYATTEPNTRAARASTPRRPTSAESAPAHDHGGWQLPCWRTRTITSFRSPSASATNKLQLAYYNDRVKDPALLGVGDIITYTGDVLPDVYSGTFNYNGGELQAQGVRFVLQHRLSNDLTATVDYGYGGVLDLQQPNVDWSYGRSNLDMDGDTRQP